MSRRSEERAGVEEWREAADPDAAKPRSTLKRTLVRIAVVVLVAVALFMAWRVLGAR